MVMAYAVYLHRTPVRAATVVRYMNGLKDFYRSRGMAEFGDRTAWPDFHRMLKGIRRLDRRGAQFPAWGRVMCVPRRSAGCVDPAPRRQSMAYREYLTLPAAKALEATRAMFRLMSQPAAEGGFGASVFQAGLEPKDNAIGGRGALG
eukprot:jgi/Ulvmu1/9965/UM059_0014.1